MEYIEKSPASTARAVIDSYIQSAQQTGISPSYQDFKNRTDNHNEKFEKHFKDEQIKEQHNKCCYCMRSISAGESTIEHIIPRKVSTLEEFDHYRNERNTILKHCNIAIHQLASPNQVSLEIAYENLVLSCGGHFTTKTPLCCNNKRGDKFIPPFILDPHIHQEFEYHKNGIVTWPNDPEKNPNNPSVTILGLNNDFLSMIRCLYQIIQEQNINPQDQDFNRSAFFEKIKSIVLKKHETADQSIIDKKKAILSFLEQDKYWNLFLKYDYFQTQVFM